MHLSSSFFHSFCSAEIFILSLYRSRILSFLVFCSKFSAFCSTVMYSRPLENHFPGQAFEDDKSTEDHSTRQFKWSPLDMSTLFVPVTQNSSLPRLAVKILYPARSFF
jgi:hypothetical protein